MEKIKVITDEERVFIQSSMDVRLALNEITDLNLEESYRVGDTAVMIEDIEQNGIYKNNFANKDTYYIVLRILGENVGFAYSLY